jgi:hypothetical protein
VVRVSRAAVANAVVVDVAEEGSSMEEGTSMSTGKLVLSTALRNCARALSHETQDCNNDCFGLDC